MLLSMWILADWLKEYHPETKIENGSCILRNARLYADGLKLSRSTVYLNQIDAQKVMCSNGHDIIIVQADDLNEVLNRILDAFEYYNEWQENMNICIQEMRPLSDLLDICNSVFCAALIMADATFYMREICGSEELCQQLISTRQVPESHLLPLTDLLTISHLDFIRKSNVPAYCVTIPNRQNAAVTNLFSEGKHIGWLILLAPSGSYTQQNDFFYILNLNLTDENRIEEQLHSLLQRSGCCAVKSSPFSNILQLKNFTDSLLILADYLELQAGKILSSETALLPYIAALLNNQSALSLSSPVVQQLEDYDFHNKTDLSATLCCFLKNNCNYATTAKQLYIHRSTLLYRMERIQELTSVNLNSYETRLHLQITYLLKEYGLKNIHNLS